MAAVPGLGAVTGTIFHGLQIKTGPRADFTTTSTTPTTPQGGCCFLPVSSEKHFEKTPDALSQSSDFRYFVYSRVLLEWIQPLIYCSNNTASGRTGSENPEWVFKKWTVERWPSIFRKKHNRTNEDKCLCHWKTILWSTKICGPFGFCWKCREILHNSTHEAGFATVTRGPPTPADQRLWLTPVHVANN